MEEDKKTTQEILDQAIEALDEVAWKMAIFLDGIKRWHKRLKEEN